MKAPDIVPDSSAKTPLPLDPPGASAYHRWMEQELEILEARLSQLLGNLHRLVESNQRLASELREAESTNAELRQRIAEARSRVTLALARLPGEHPQISDQPHPGDEAPSPEINRSTAVAA